MGYASHDYWTGFGTGEDGDDDVLTFQRPVLGQKNSPLSKRDEAMARALTGHLTALQQDEEIVRLTADARRWTGAHHDGPPSYDLLMTRLNSEFFLLLQRIGVCPSDEYPKAMRQDRQSASVVAGGRLAVSKRRPDFGHVNLPPHEHVLSEGDRLIVAVPEPDLHIAARPEIGNEALLMSVVPNRKFGAADMELKGFDDLSSAMRKELLEVFQFQFEPVAF